MVIYPPNDSWVMLIPFKYSLLNNSCRTVLYEISNFEPKIVQIYKPSCIMKIQKLLKHVK